MRFQNSSLYIQYQIDWILQLHCSYTWAYIDDIVVFFKTLEKHLVHLNNIFKLLTSLNIVFISIKTFLEFLSITFLSQKVDSFSMTAAVKKI